MGTGFNYFQEIIPPAIYDRTKTTICRHLAVFEPEGYALGQVLRVDDYHFILFFATPPVTVINGVEYRPKKGDMLVVQPWQGVYGVPESSYKDEGKYMHITVKEGFFRKIAAESAGAGEFSFARVHGAYSRRLLDLIGEFQQELVNYGEAYPQMIRSLCTQIVFQLIRDLQAGETKGRKNSGRENQYIQQAIRFMEEHYQTCVTIRDICDLIYLSPYHFKRIFKEHTGRTPHRYLTEIRIEKAKELLATNEGTIEDIAGLCGFVNAGHFAVVFKRETHLSPSEYRKKYGKK